MADAVNMPTHPANSSQENWKSLGELARKIAEQHK